VVGKVQQDREFMARCIKVENVNRKNHCDLVKMGAKRKKIRMRKLFQGDSKNIQSIPVISPATQVGPCYNRDALK
jgi:hypothetical protein